MRTLLWVLCLAIGFEAWAQPGEGGLYQATVPLAENSESGLAAAFAQAMRQVLVQATGRAGTHEEAALAPLVRDASKYVQQYQILAGGLLFVGFDGRRIERLIAASDPSQIQPVRLAIDGIGTVDAYAQVTGYLESLMQLGDLEVEALSGQTVVYRASVRGGMDKLAQAIELNPQLQPETGPGTGDGTAGLFRYRFTP